MLLKHLVHVGNKPEVVVQAAKDWHGWIPALRDALGIRALAHTLLSVPSSHGHRDDQ